MSGAVKPADAWRLRIYILGFLVAFVLHLIANGIERPPAILLLAVLILAAGLWKGRGAWLRYGVVLAIVHTAIFPVLRLAVGGGETIMIVVSKVPIWSQLLVALIGSRLLAAECRLSFAAFWYRPAANGNAVEIQSFAAALALGYFLTLSFYLLAPHISGAFTGQASRIIGSAIRGETIIHGAIIFVFFVIVASIFDSMLLHVADRTALAAFTAQVEKKTAADAEISASDILAQEFESLRHTRAARLLNGVFRNGGDGAADRLNLEAISFDGFRTASRQFVRMLVPLLPLLGFLGTVIGLAAAISELPSGLTGPAGHAFDISASLAGLAVKFETTLLGLMASMISSFSLNLLEKRETEFAAACALVAKDVMGRDV